ncbi:MAG: hypothetical protein GTN76_00240 [Candidatus Aenigmarchaeota archaeon]|nr:hypothetical protein [Candidatus Aenigmarchaeota archaeon]
MRKAFILLVVLSFLLMSCTSKSIVPLENNQYLLKVKSGSGKHAEKILDKMAREKCRNYVIKGRAVHLDVKFIYPQHAEQEFEWIIQCP